MNDYASTFIWTMLLFVVIYGISFVLWWKFLPKHHQRIKLVMIVIGILFAIFSFVGIYMITTVSKLMA